MAAAWNELPDSGELTECAALVRSAEALCPGAPELAVQLARRALVVGASESAGLAGGGRARSVAASLSMRAQAVLVAGLVRTSQHVDAVEPAFAALALAEAGGVSDVAVSVRLDLSACAREIGEPLLGAALLRSVLEAGQVRSSVRATALGRFVGCVAHVARRDDVEDALAEADRLLAADDGMSPDARRMERARLSVRSAAYHRWYGDTEEAMTAARDGLGMLSRLRRELRAECDRVRARLVFELVCALLDDGELDGAATEAAPLVDAPVRATSAAAVGQLMLAVATRVHLPAGQVDRGRSLLDQAAWLAERHRIDSVLADALTEISRLDERAGRMADALAALRAARAAEQRRLRAITRASRRILTELGNVDAGTDTGQQALTALLRQLTHSGRAVPATRSPLPPPRSSPEPHGPAPHTDAATGLLNREGLFRRLRSVRNGERPVALTLVRIDRTSEPPTPAHPANLDLTELAGRVKAIAPAHAELARPDGGELAVLLPHTTRDQAERVAATIRETAIDAVWRADATGAHLRLSTGVVQSADPTPGDDDRVDAGELLTAARAALVPVQLGTTTGDTRADTAAELASALAENPTTWPPQETPATSPQPETPESALSEDTPTRPLPDVTGASESLTVGRSILSSLSIPTGSGGKRRAEGERSGWPTESGANPASRRPSEATTGPPHPPEHPTGRSTYEQTKAELARMMSELTSGTLRVPPQSRSDEPSADSPTSDHPHSHPGDHAGSSTSARAGGHPGASSTAGYAGDFAGGSTSAGAGGHPGASSTAGYAGDAPGGSTGGYADGRSGDYAGSEGGPVPQQSIPTPPTPEEVSDPPRRADFPEPAEPHPTPSERGLTPPDPAPAQLAQGSTPPEPGLKPLEPDPTSPDPRDRGSALLESDFAPHKPGSALSDLGSAVPGSGSASHKPGSALSDLGPALPDSGTAPPDPGTAPPDSGSALPKLGTAPPDPGTDPPDPSPAAPEPDPSPPPEPDSPPAWSTGASAHPPDPPPANPLFDTGDEAPAGPTGGWQPRAPFKSSLAAAFESFGAPDPEPAQNPPASDDELGPLQGPEPRPSDFPSRRDRSDSTTIAGLLAEALAAYQSTSNDEDEHEHEEEQKDSWSPSDDWATNTQTPRLPDLTAPGQPEPTSTPFSDLRAQSGVPGRHRSPE